MLSSWSHQNYAARLGAGAASLRTCQSATTSASQLGEYLAADIDAELRYRDQFKDLPSPAITPVDPDGGMPDRWAREFRRYRLTERMGKSRPGLGLRLEFPDDVQGPVLLGQLSHFGYGIFMPDPD